MNRLWFYRLLQGMARAKHHAELFPDFESALRIPAIDNGESEPPGRHRVQLRSLVFVKSHLNAANAPTAEKFLHRIVVRFLIARAVRSEQHDAVTCPAVVIVIAPAAAGIEIDDSVDPTSPVEVRPLVGEAQMGLDDFGADSLEIHAAGITFEVAAQPVAAISFDLRP